MKNNYEFNLSLDYIQNIRFLLSLTEAGIPFKSEEQSNSIEFLENLFNIEKIVSNNKHTLKKNILGFDHEKPYLQVGQLKKPLIFPHALLNYCYQRWDVKNKKNITFRGLITNDREVVINKWLEKQYRVSIPKPKLNSENLFIKKLKLKFFKGFTFKYKNCSITETFNGRRFPEKIWDEEYYTEMLSSKLTLCPDGAFTWTYRFFESIICGAIPIIENYCDLYEGYYFYSMEDDLDKLIITREMLEYNFNKLRSELCFNKDEIEYINKILHIEANNE